MRPAAAGLLLLILAACGSGGSDGGEGVTVVATTSILGDVAGRLVGGDGSVEVLIPRGADPHDAQLSPQQAALLRHADLVVANGLGLEEGLEDALAAAEAEGTVVLRLAPLVDPIPFAAAGDRRSQGDDPHFWHDASRMADAVLVMGERLSAVTGPGAPDWTERAATLAEELRALDRELAAAYQAVPAERRKLVTSHSSLGYLADRYGFEMLGSVIPGGSTLAEPSSADLAALVEVIRENEVQAIFTEGFVAPRLVEALAAEVGPDVRVVPLVTDSLEPAGSEADTYEAMMRVNAERIVAALAPDREGAERMTWIG